MNLCSSFSGAALMRDSFIREFDGLRFSGLTDLHVLTQQWTVVSLCWYSSWMGLFTVGQHHCLMCDVSVPILPHLHFLFWVQKWEYLNGKGSMWSTVAITNECQRRWLYRISMDVVYSSRWKGLLWSTVNGWYFGYVAEEEGPPPL